MPDVDAAYGFGSFFRNEKFNDIDLLVVATKDCKDGLATYYAIRRRLQALASRLKFKLHLTFLTAKEFKSRPLLEMDHLVALWRRPRSRLVVPD